MSSINSVTAGTSQPRAAPIPLAETRRPVDHRWPPLATVAFVVTTSGALWAAIIIAVRQFLS